MKGITYVTGFVEKLCVLSIFDKNMQIRLIFILKNHLKKVS